MSDVTNEVVAEFKVSDDDYNYSFKESVQKR